MSNGGLPVGSRAVRICQERIRLIIRANRISAAACMMTRQRISLLDCWGVPPRAMLTRPVRSTPTVANIARPTMTGRMLCMDIRIGGFAELCSPVSWQPSLARIAAVDLTVRFMVRPR